MELYDEEKQKNGDMKRNDKEKYIKIGIVVTLSLFFIFLILLFALPKEKEEISMTFYIDNIKTSIPDGLFIIEPETNKLYVSLSKMSKILKYNYYRGEYLERYTEDINKCYIDNGNEFVSYILGTNKIYKTDTNKIGSNTYYYIEDNVIANGEQLYTNSKGIEIGFNLKINYNETNKEISIQSLQYLSNYYKTLLNNNDKGLVTVDATIDDKKLILSGYVIMSGVDGNLGVSNLEGKLIIGTKYSAIKYIEQTKEFLVSSNGKTGILSTKGETKIRLNYDEISLLSDSLRLYAVRRDGMYGVLDRNGEILIHIENSRIGIEDSLYPKNRISNARLIYDNCIPVQKNGKWGIYDVKGNILLPFEYSKIGFTVSTTNEKKINNAALLEDIDGIIIAQEITNEKNKITKYGVVNSVGEILVPCVFDKIYSITEAEQEIYYLEKGEEIISLDNYIIQYNLKSYKNNTLFKKEITNLNETENNITNSISDNNNIIIENEIENKI